MDYDKETIKNQIYEKLKKYPLGVQAFIFEYEYDSYTSKIDQEIATKTLNGLENARIILTALKEIMLETGFDKESQTLKNITSNPYNKGQIEKNYPQ